jgi:hypothetical protein
VNVALAFLVPFAQCAVPHATLVGANRHRPWPQNPSAPQTSMPAAHSFSGSVPSTTSAQVPSVRWPVSTARQETHRPVHALSQQTRSTQFVEAHSCAALHAVPLILFGVQVELFGSQ